MPIDTQHPEYTKQSPRWKRCRDVALGQDAIHDAGELYLPKLKEQDPESYKAYKLRATFYNATWRTISGLTGMIMRQPPAVEVPEVAVPMMEDVTMSGVPLHSFAQTIAEEALTEGRVGILVDCPKVKAANGSATLADAQAQNIRPTLSMYLAESIINWRTSQVNNRTVLTLVVLKEAEEVAVDEYAMKLEERWRELSLVNGLYRVREFRKRSTDAQQQGGGMFEQVGEDVFPTQNAKPMDYIPFQFVGPTDLTPEVDAPPLIDLVDVNLAHYRVTADYEHGCHFTGLPTAVISGYVPEVGKVLYIGSSAAWTFPDANAKATYLEFSGQGLDSLVKNLAGKEQQMAILGARMLEPQKKAAETSDSASIRRKGEESLLSAAAQTLSLAMTKVLTWFSAFAGAADAEVKFEFNRDFFPSPMSAPELSALVLAWQQGAISYQTLFANLQQGEIIGQEVTIEEEQARTAEDQAALAAQQALYNQSGAEGGGIGGGDLNPGNGT